MYIIYVDIYEINIFYINKTHTHTYMQENDKHKIQGNAYMLIMGEGEARRLVQVTSNVLILVLSGEFSYYCCLLLLILKSQ